MNYKIGDKVIHWTYGVGTVIAIDRMLLSGVTQQYYVVMIDLLKLWVPVEEANVSSIRLPTNKAEFEALFEILGSPGKQLSENQFARKNELREFLKKRTLEGLCHLIRDLTDWSREHTLNQYDASVLFRAEKQLLDEWALSLDVDRVNALRDLEKLLDINLQSLLDDEKPVTPRQNIKSR